MGRAIRAALESARRRGRGHGRPQHAPQPGAGRRSGRWTWPSSSAMRRRCSTMSRLGARCRLPRARHRHDRLGRRAGRPGPALDRDARGGRRPSASSRPTFSLGVVLFAELAEQAARLFGRFREYDPYVFEQHRRPSPTGRRARRSPSPSGSCRTCRSKRRARLAEGPGAPDPDVLEVVALRAGASPGMHIVGFDAPGESLELRITARDRSAYVAGALLAADSPAGGSRPHGHHHFETLVRERIA